jgi:hypothetical protein
MTTTRNGFTVQPPGSVNLEKFDYKGVPFIVWRPAVAAFKWLIGELDRIEPIGEAGWDGGYNHRLIAGTTIWSEHAAGTAIDWNASQHLRTGKPAQGWTNQQFHDVHVIMRTTRGQYFRWGADFKDPDPMHFELRSRVLWDRTDNPFTHPYISYTVKGGDTLTLIATAYHTTVAVVYSLNRSVIGADPNHILPGMVLRVPR